MGGRGRIVLREERLGFAPGSQAVPTFGRSFPFTAASLTSKEQPTGSINRQAPSRSRSRTTTGTEARSTPGFWRTRRRPSEVGTLGVRRVDREPRTRRRRARNRDEPRLVPVRGLRRGDRALAELGGGLGGLSARRVLPPLRVGTSTTFEPWRPGAGRRADPARRLRPLVQPGGTRSRLVSEPRALRRRTHAARRSDSMAAPTE